MTGSVSCWPALVAPALLAVVAAGQIVLAQVADLTPWKGGGFGMFASLDHAPFRGIDIIVEAADRSEAIQVSPSLEVVAARATALPADALLVKLAEAVAAREARHSRAVETVKLRVWRHEFDPITLRSTEHLVRSYSYRVR